MKLAEGRLASRPDEEVLLRHICSQPGNHLEIGTLWGATSIIAAEMKPEPWRIFAIDIMRGGYWVDGDPSMKDHPRPTARAILNNFRLNNVAHRITLICSDSNPLPIPESIEIGTALIDGGHGEVACRHDWENLSPRVKSYIAIHDYATGKHPGVQKVVDDVVMADNDWEFFDQAGTLLVMKRK